MPRRQLSGTAEAGATVTIYDGDTVLGTVVAGEDGTLELHAGYPGRGRPQPEHHRDGQGGNVSERFLRAFELTVDTSRDRLSARLQVTDDVAGHTPAR
ncbi:hypothetical protein KQJ77_12035 [Klebsiella oxytoca]|nr:hypothetical protein [Klebsiella oxytoca]